MAKKFKSAASSSRIQPSTNAVGFGVAPTGSVFGSSFGAAPTSQLSYVYEPPDLTTISDSSLVVAFKNLQKKDGTTKAKALDELLTYLGQADGAETGVEDGIIEAWTKLYARASIENTRQVRQRAHTFQGRLTTICGKRIAKSLPSLIGPWLCGLQDNDKLVVRSAQEAFAAAFSSEDKRAGVWKVYHASILGYCSAIILNETAKTLSDERVTSEDDAESKYSRTVGSAILTVLQSLETVAKEQVDKEAHEYNSMFDADVLWALASSNDSFTRQAVYRAAIVRVRKLESRPDPSTLKCLASNFIGKALRTDQTGSSTLFVQALTILTKAYPELWTEHFVSKKRSSSQNLEYFLKNLPPGPVQEFWTNLDGLLASVPSQVLLGQRTTKSESDEKTEQSDALPVLRSLHQGITRRDNFRSGVGSSWRSYLHLSKIVAPLLQDDSRARTLASEMLFPLTRHFVLPEGESNLWVVTDREAMAIAIDSILLASNVSEEATAECITSLSSSLIEMMQTSLPEQSKGFLESQNKVQRAFDRWSKVKIALLKRSNSTALTTVLRETTRAEAERAIEVLKSRNGKPFGAAQALQLAMSYLETSPERDQELQRNITAFLEDKGPELIGSASTEQLLMLFQHIDAIDSNSRLYERCLKQILDQPDSVERNTALSHLLKSSWPTQTDISDALSHQVRTALKRLEEGDRTQAEQVNSTLSNRSAPSGLVDELLSMLIESLSTGEKVSQGVQSLSLAANHNSNAFGSFLGSNNGSKLATKLLLLSQSSLEPETKQKASQLNARVQALTLEGGDSQRYAESLVASVTDGLRDANLQVGAVVELARQATVACKDDTALLKQLLPSADDWKLAIDPHLASKPSSALGLMNALGGAVNLADVHGTASAEVVYDSEGLSRAGRNATYVLRLIDQSFPFGSIDMGTQMTTLSNLAVFNQLASDALSVPSGAPVWRSDETSIDEMADTLSRCQNFVQHHALQETSVRQSLLACLLASSEGTSVLSYYAARAFVVLAQETIEGHGSAVECAEDDLISRLKKASGSMQDVALFVSYSETSNISKLVNTLVAELAAHDFDDDPDKGLKMLLLLSPLLDSPQFNGSLFSQKHRLALFVKHIVAAVSLNNQPSLNSELIKAAEATLHLVASVYDDFWNDLIQFLVSYFSSRSHDVRLTNIALKLYKKLKTISQDKDETNEDFVEAWPNSEKALQNSFLDLICSQSEVTDMHNKPRQIVNENLGRLFGSINEANLDVDQLPLYQVLSSRSPPLQEASFKFLHRMIPRLQQKIVMDAALAKDYKATLPVQLLEITSTILDEALELSSAPNIPSTLLQYVLGWKLIFDHWFGASYQVQNDYVESVKESGNVKLLLDTAFDFLIASRYKPFDASKVRVETFNLDEGDNPEQQVLKAFCHLYLLALRHLPALVRTWYRDECPRSLQRPVKEWTEKHMSPRVIDAELAEVTAWIPKQETDAPLEVKVASRAREVTAMYPVDEQMAAIRVSLPADYPLSSIIVEDLNRIGVDERKWRAWLINAQGTMNFAPSSGGLGAVTDGLVAWRRNVTGTLKGQSECAICYSIVNADRQLPVKKCGTCKNAFHGTCLFRWFKSSSGSSCPLCRNAFNYG